MKPLLFLAVLFAATSSLKAQKVVVSYDTTSPNQFWFSSSEYVVNESETNVVLTVQWQAGDRGYSGFVDYYTSGGNAAAGSDYTSVSNRLYFSGPAWKTITIPVSSDCTSEGDESFEVHLVNPNAIIANPVTTVRITDGACVPKLEMVTSSQNSVALSWPSEASGFVLQRSRDFNAWEDAPVTYSLASGKYATVMPTTNGYSFFRLRKSASTP